MAAVVNAVLLEYPSEAVIAQRRSFPARAGAVARVAPGSAVKSV